MELQLTTWERIALIQAVGNLRGPVSLVRNAGKLLDILELSDADIRTVGLVAVSGGGLRWNDQEREWPLTVPDGNLVILLKQTVQGFDQWGPGDLARIEGLLAKLGIAD